MGIIEGTSAIAENMLFVFPVHPPTRASTQEFGLGNCSTNLLDGGKIETDRVIYLIEPAGSLDFLHLMSKVWLLR